MPMFGNDDVDYHYDTALNHTEKMVKEIRNRGIKVLSYYIGDSYDGNRNMSEFKRMYGKDCQFVDVSSVKELAMRWYPEIEEKMPPKMETHRALDDIIESIKELKFYRKNLFR